VAGNVVANVYANALVEIGQEKKILDRLEEELGFIVGLISEDRDVEIYLNAPGISPDAKKEFIDRVFGGEFSETIVNLLKVLVDNGRQALLKSINEAFVELLDVVNNRQRVTVISSMKLGKDVLDKVQASLSEKLKKNIILDDAVDESILGGIILRMGDIILDGSMANDLKNIRHNLLNSKVRGDRAYED